jgi:hypothetical protein
MTALETPLSLKAHVNGHYGFRRELPTGPLAVRSSPTAIRSYPRLALPSAGGDAGVIRARPITARKRSGLHGATVT